MTAPTDQAAASRCEELAEPAGPTLEPGEIRGIVLGEVNEIAPDGRVVVTLRIAQRTFRVLAVALERIEQGHIGARVAVAFEQSDVNRPVVVGLLHESHQPHRTASGGRPSVLSLSAERVVEIRCGESSIRLEADGKIVIRGDRLLSRARKTNRIKGGSIQLN